MNIQAENPLDSSEQREAVEADDNIPEATPPWLQALLRKYGEREGPLSGLQIVYDDVPPSPDLDLTRKGTGDISDVLDDLATDAPKPQTGRLASSVDWGVTTETEPSTSTSAVDDLLATYQEPQLESDAPSDPSPPSSSDERPDDLETMPPDLATPDTPADQPSAMETFEVPDWLNELAGSEAEAESPPSSSDSLSATEDSQIVPDWMQTIEISPEDMPTPPPASQTAEPEIPDWLNEIDDTPSQGQAQQPDSDRLAEAEPSQPDQAGETVASQIEEMPDWLEGFDEPTGAETSTFETPPAEAGQTAQSDAGTEPETLDWLAQMNAEQPETDVPAEIAEPESVQPTSSERAEDVDDWLSQLGLPAETAKPAPTETGESDWLAEIIATESSPSSEAWPSAEADEPPTSQRSSLETQVTLEDGGEELADDDDWLQAVMTHYALDTDQQVEDSPEIVSSEDTVSSTLEAESDELPDWLAELGSTPAEETSSEANLGWLAETATDDETQPQQPQPTTDEEQPAALSEWMAELRQVAEPPQTDEPADAQDDLGWLSGVMEDADSEGQIESEFVSELPDWMTGIEEGTAAPKAEDLALRVDDVQPEQPVGIDEADAEPPQEQLQIAAAGIDAVMPEVVEASDIEQDEGEFLDHLTADELPPRQLSQAEAQVTGEGVEHLAPVSEAEQVTPDWLIALEEEARTVTQVGLPAWIQDFEVSLGDDMKTVPLKAAAVPIPPPEVQAKGSVEDLAELTDDVEDAASGIKVVRAGSDISELDESGFAAIGPKLTAESDSQPVEAESLLAGLEIEEVDESDWLSETQAEAVEADSSDLDAGETVEMPDWMIGLDEAPDAALVEGTEPAAETEAGEASSDWLLELRAEAMEVEETAVDETTLSSDLPDWMYGLDDATDTGALKLEAAANDTEAAISTDPPVTDEFAQADEALEQPEVSKEPKIIYPEEPEPLPEIPDWMYNLADEPEATAVEPLSSEEAALATDDAGALPEIPDWMANLEVDEEAPAPFASEAGTMPDLPDWMLELEAEVTDEATSKADAKVEDEADWLTQLRAEAADEPAADLAEPDTTVAIPEWMQTLEVEPLAEQAADIGQQIDATEELEIPPDGETLPAETGEFTVEAEAESVEDTFDWMVEEDQPDDDDKADTGQNPDWLSALRQDAAHDEDEEVKDDVTENESTPSIPDWMAILGDEPPPDTAPDLPLSEAEEESSVNLDWLSMLEQEDDLSPDWLDETDSDQLPPPGDRGTGPPRQSSRNPLAGLFSSSPSPPEDVFQEPTGTADSERKESSEQEQEDDDDSVRPVASALAAAGVTISTTAAPQLLNAVFVAPKMPALQENAQPDLAWMGRIGGASLYLIFLLAISLPLFFHFDRGGYPFPWLEPSLDEQEAIRNRLQGALGDKLPGSVALVAFDYTPANEGEMTPLAREVVKKLRGQGLRVIAFSLQPEGAAMAQQVLDEVAPDGYGTDVVNLGYRPGGPLAVRQLSFERPLHSGIDFKTQQPYQAPDGWPEINSLNDAALIVDISATADSPRWWVEQLESADRPPIVAAVSAAAEPFVLPYTRSGQVAAIIAGINGAAALESTRLQETLGPASSMLDSQSVAHLLLMTLMLFGTIAGLVHTMAGK